MSNNNKNDDIIRKQPVAISGTSEQIAAAWAQVNGRLIKKHVTNFLADLKQRNIPRSKLLHQTDVFIAIAKKYGSHWLDEATCLAKACRLKPEIYIGYMASVYRSLLCAEECTSYTISKKVTAGDKVLFHKTRDNEKKEQSAFILTPAGKKLNKFIAVTDAAVIGCMMMVNEKGLAGSADTYAQFKSGKPVYEGLMNVFMLRLIAERAADCLEAIDIIKEFTAKRLYAGGTIDGTHWLLTDKTGTSYEVCSNACEVTSRRITEDFYVSCPRKGIPQAYKKLPKPVTFHKFHSLSRLPGMCLNTSVSGMTVEIDPLRPDIDTCAWIGLPAKSYLLPLMMGGSATPYGLLSGGVYTRGETAVLDGRTRELYHFFDEENNAIKNSLIKNLHADKASKKETTEAYNTWMHQQEKKYTILAT